MPVKLSRVLFGCRYMSLCVLLTVVIYLCVQRSSAGVCVAQQAGVVSVHSSSQTDKAVNDWPFLDLRLPLQARVDNLVGLLTPEEKASLMVNHSHAIPRLGIPEYDWWNEGLHGVARAGIATVFPQAIGMAATWDAPLIERVGDIVSTEARVKYAESQARGERGRYRGLTLWSPNINIFRDPRWGRGQETYGEDPLLSGELGSAYIRGLQGKDPNYFKVVATAKHFAVHSGPEPSRHVFDARPSPQDMQATYLPAFQAAVTAGGAYSVMCSYNAVDGTPACANPALMETTLRKDWGFRGVVVSDCGAIHDIALTHQFARDIAEAAAMAVRAGTDLDCDNEYLELPKAVARGLITQEQIDISLRRVLLTRFRLGLFDAAERNPWRELTAADNDSPAHRDAALLMAKESLTLLKNERHALPLNKTVRDIAVLGPNADSLDALEGEYNGTPRSPVSVLEGMQTVFAGKAAVTYAQGSPLVEELPVPIPAYEFGIGLKAEYFANTTFDGPPAVSRTDAQIRFDWRQANPVMGVGIRGYSVRWSGTLVPTISGAAKLGTQRGFCWDCKTPDPVRVWVDGKLLTDDLGSGKANQITVNDIVLEKGKPLNLRVEYVNTSAEGQVYLVWMPPVEQQRAEAVALAKRSDAVVLVLGISAQLEGEEMPVKVAGFRGGDRTSLDLPAVQRQLFDAIVATGKPVSVVLLNGSALALHEVAEKASAVLEAWYPGEEGGRAVAEALAGNYSPAGRLPVTFYQSTEQLPPFDDYSMGKRTYRYMAETPQFGFGFGLSYTTFVYRHAVVSAPRADGAVEVSVDVANTGGVASDEVVQAYLVPPAAAGGPNVQLAAFRRVSIGAGGHRRVSLVVPAGSFEQIDRQGKRARTVGTYSMWVGGGQPSSGLPGVRMPLTVR